MTVCYSLDGVYQKADFCLVLIYHATFNLQFTSKENKEIQMANYQQQSLLSVKAISYQITDVGKTKQGLKLQHQWIILIDNVQCKVTLFHSLISGKVIASVNGKPFVQKIVPIDNVNLREHYPLIVGRHALDIILTNSSCQLMIDGQAYADINNMNNRQRETDMFGIQNAKDLNNKIMQSSLAKEFDILADEKENPKPKNAGMRRTNSETILQPLNPKQEIKVESAPATGYPNNLANQSPYQNAGFPPAFQPQHQMGNNFNQQQFQHNQNYPFPQNNFQPNYPPNFQQPPPNFQQHRPQNQYPPNNFPPQNNFCPPPHMQQMPPQNQNWQQPSNKNWPSNNLNQFPPMPFMPQQIFGDAMLMGFMANKATELINSVGQQHPQQFMQQAPVPPVQQTPTNSNNVKQNIANINTQGNMYPQISGYTADNGSNGKVPNFQSMYISPQPIQLIQFDQIPFKNQQNLPKQSLSPQIPRQDNLKIEDSWIEPSILMSKQQISTKQSIKKVQSRFVGPI